MKYDSFGQALLNESDLFDILYQQGNFDLDKFVVVDPNQYNQAVQSLNLSWPLLTAYELKNQDQESFDQDNQSKWFMPEQYQTLDIAAWVLDNCKSQEELQRCGQELLMFQERNLFNLLRYLKYLVDTMRSHGIVWGVGRGSSVASYVLYVIGVHRINSLYYDINIEEFLKG